MSNNFNAKAISSRPLVVLLLMGISLLCLPSRVLALCPNDNWAARTSVIYVTGGTKVTIATSSSVYHTITHPNCAGNVRAKTTLVGQGGPCSTSSTGSHTYATASQPCTGLPSGNYWTSGEHFFDGVKDGTSESNVVNLSGQEDECEGGCEPGHTTNCLGDQQPDECGCCVDYSPIIFDIGGRPIQMSSASNGLPFQLNEMGSVRRVAWPLEPTNAWLALDRNNDGIINDGSELFGNTTRLLSGQIAANGYVALAEFDQNADGVIDRRDPIFASLRAWVDVNRDGLSQAIELRPLDAVGVEALSVLPHESRRVDDHGNQFRYRALIRFRSQPRLRFSWDVYPVTEPLTGALLCASTKSLLVSSDDKR